MDDSQMQSTAGVWHFLTVPFTDLPVDALDQIATYLSFNPFVTEGGKQVFLSNVSIPARHTYLANHRYDLKKEFCSIGSWSFGSNKDYDQIVRDLATKLSVSFNANDKTQAVESAILTSCWKKALDGMTPDQLAELRSKAEVLAEKYGHSVGKEITGLAALGAAQLSGFGIYLAGSTILGAINGALGLGLGFGAFTGLSSLISTVIGPIGWAALGLAAILKLGAPNYKKILPVVILIASERALREQQQTTQETAASSRISRDKPTSHAALKGTYVTPISSDAISKLETDIASISKETARQKKKRSLSSPRSFSKQERNIFALRNPALCKLAKELGGVEYLDLANEDQLVVQELHRSQLESATEQAERTAEQERLAKQDAKRQRKKLEDEPSTSKSIKAMNSKRKELKHLLNEIEFSDEALCRLCALPPDDSVPFLNEFSLMNRGNIAPKDHIKSTKPSILERYAGRNGRIYYRRTDGRTSLRIELIGSKQSQSNDIQFLQRL